MSWMKQHAAALVVAVLSVIFLCFGIVSVTVLKPAQEVVASADVNQPYVMTRSGLLPVLGPNATVTVTSDSADTVVLAYGTSADVKGWIGGSGFNEVVGIKSGMEELMLEEHPAQDTQSLSSTEPTENIDEQSGSQSGDARQSGAQSGAQSGEQTGSNAASEESEALQAEENESPAGSDMWLDQQSGQGQATMNLTNVGTDRSILAAVEGGSGPSTITITWAVQRTNGWGIASFVLAGVFALIAVILFVLGALRKSRHTDVWAEGHSQEASEQQESVLETVGRAGVGQKAAELESTDQQAAAPQQQLDEQTAHHQAAAQQQSDQKPSAPQSADLGELAQADGDISGTNRSEKTDQALRPHAMPDPSSGSQPAQGPVTEPSQAPVTEPSPELVTQSASEPVKEPEALTGRHALLSPDGTPPTDSAQKEPTDTGIIDLSGIRPGMVLPSRRALREARERGEQRITVGGHEFQTGLIPKASGPASSNAPGDGAVRSDTERGASSDESQQGDNAVQGPDFEQRTIDRGGWHSLMDRWTHKGDSDEA